MPKFKVTTGSLLNTEINAFDKHEAAVVLKQLRASKVVLAEEADLTQV